MSERFDNIRWGVTMIALDCRACGEAMAVCSERQFVEQGDQFTAEQRESCRPFVERHAGHDWTICPMQVGELPEA